MPEPASPRFESVYQRLRAWLGGQLILDTRRAGLWFEDERRPLWAVPRQDLRVTLEPVGGDDGDPDQPESWTLVAGSVRRAGAAHTPAVTVQPGAGELVVLHPDAADRWLEEERPVHGMPRNPYHRVDALASSRAVRFVVGGEVVADTIRPVLVIETGVVPRWYVPPGDVVWDRLMPDPTVTVCQYKGEASYHRVAGSDVRLWSYQHPDPEVAGIAGMLAAGGEDPGVEIMIDDRPEPHR